MGMILRLKDLGDKCELIKPEDCNLAWRSIFTLNSVVVFNLLIPTLLGLVGIVLHFRFIIRCVTACLRFAAFIVAITFFGHGINETQLCALPQWLRAPLRLLAWWCSWQGTNTLESWTSAIEQSGETQRSRDFLVLPNSTFQSVGRVLLTLVVPQVPMGHGLACKKQGLVA